MAGSIGALWEVTKRARDRLVGWDRLVATGEALFGVAKGVAERIVSPLRRGDGPNKFRLSAMDTATTTYDGDDGWASRPPAVLECPRCGGDIPQHHARDDIDCPHCVAEFSYREFPELELKHLTCPVCRSEMTHGQRHPESFDIVEWATCNGCRYHWEFKHSYS
ncbi:hypothetical protein [Halobellus sp. EA9]|uniref:hypothetical protein n=1 Tax=Halobellus sp. EA9 TaxID=3421647 RepID=UPI003EBE2EAC